MTSNLSSHDELPPPRLATWIATGFGSGYSPVAPGTAGTLVAIPLVAVLAPLAVASPTLYLLTLAASIALAIWSAGLAAVGFGLKDPGQIVIDEVVGLFLTMAFLPATWTNLAAAFLLFRLFDIVKPPPVRWLDENLPGGWGVVLDDVAAGVMGAIVMGVATYFGAWDAIAGL